MTSQTRLIAARIAVRAAARGFVAGNVNASELRTATARALRAAETIVLDRQALRDARRMVDKSRIDRILNGRGDLWNGSDRAFQFDMLNMAARLRRAVTFCG